MTIQTALLQGAKLLAEDSIAVPSLTAEVLLCRALNRERQYLFAHPEEELTEVAWLHYGRYLHQRLNGKPTQYITGRQEFYGRDFLVTPDVLIPRPETEHLVEACLALIRPADKLLDVGTGSGAIAISSPWRPRRQVYATDISTAALRIASENARKTLAQVGLARLPTWSLASPMPTSIWWLPTHPTSPERTSPRSSAKSAITSPKSHYSLDPSGLEHLRTPNPGSSPRAASRRLAVARTRVQFVKPVRKMLGPEWTEITVQPDLAASPGS